MAIIKAHGSFVSFTLSFEDDGYVGVSEGLLSLGFNLHDGTMCIEQEMYYEDGDVSKIILMQKNKSEDDSMWILDLGSFKVIDHSDS